MKKLLLCFELCFLLSATLSARGQFIYGFSVGGNLSNAREKDDLKTFIRGYLAGLHLGAESGYFFNDHWGVLSGISYEGKGFKSQKGDDSIITRLHYIELPLKLDYRLESGNNLFVASGGLYGAYGFKGKVSFRGTPERNYDPFRNSNYKRFDLGYVLEAMYVLENNLGFRILFSHGLTNLYDDSDDTLRNFLFQGALVFMLKK